MTSSSRKSRFHAWASTACAVVLVTAFSFMISGTARPASAQTIPPIPVIPCGVGFGIQYECAYNDLAQFYANESLHSFQFAVVTGILNASTFFTQKIATDIAQWMVNGFNGQGTGFYGKTVGGYLADVTMSSGDAFLTQIDGFTTELLGFGLCHPFTLEAKLALSLSLNPPLNIDRDCTFKKIGESFEQTYRALSPEDLQNTIRESLRPGGNDISISIASNNKLLGTILDKRADALLQRQENGGFKTVGDLLTGRITTPAQVVQTTVAEGNLIKRVIAGQSISTNALAQAALVAGIKELPQIAAATFVNTLAVGLLQKAFDALGAVEDNVSRADLLNPESQVQGGGAFRASVVSDILTPNLLTSEKQDFLYELTTCNTPRGPWGCSMDDGFANALRSVTESGAYTIARAAGIGTAPPSNVFLRKDWELIPATEPKDNQDPGCYQRAYCASNLAKMRFARIISVGWELAANSPYNKKVNGKYVTLEEVVTRFNDCNDNGLADASHPWCHLINPSWVLTVPQFECRIKGYGDTIFPGGVSMRVQECSDLVSCLRANDHGDCVGGYGYCLSEKTSWRFGADECAEKYVSCRTYTTRDKSKSLAGINVADAPTGPQASYIRNTIDYGSCSQDTVGCGYYFTLRDVSTTSTDVWVQSFSAGSAPPQDYIYQNASGTTLSPRVYFDATAAPCDAGSDGCTKVYDMRLGQSALNIVRNGSFERTAADNAALLQHWTPDAGFVFAPFVAAEGNSSEQGSVALSFTSTHEVTQTVDLVPLRNYVLSYYARATTANANGAVASVAVSLQDKNGNVLPTGSFYRSINCNTIGVALAGSYASVGANLTDTAWARYTCEFASDLDARFGEIHVRGTNAAIDGIQLEEGDYATSYIDGVNTSLPVDYVKLPPSELLCTGNRDTDRAECANFAQMCQQTEVGCQGYREVNGFDQTEIPATLSAVDACPNSCVGYAEYRKLPSSFDLVHTADPLTDDTDPSELNPTYMIPKSAAQCSAAAAGCEEFTNVEGLENGGEQKNYFTYVRACEKPNDLTHTYFTWEGSDTTGYQLRTWSLIQDASVTPRPPKMLQKAGPNGVVKDPSGCNESAWKTGADPDCRQFYDEQGNPFYLYFSQTVLSTPDCRNFRKNGSTFDDCTKTGGAYNQSTSECVYQVLAEQSNRCSAVDASCRGYLGTTGRNTATVLHEDFASATGSVVVSDPAVTTIEISNESLLVGDHSLKISGLGSLSAQSFFTSATGTLYKASFWAKTTDASQSTATLLVDGASVGTFTMAVDWKRYEIGPFTVTTPATGTVIAWSNLPNITYLDTIDVVRLQDVSYVKMNSWLTPPECDETTEGIPQPQAMLGCREYQDRKGSVVDVRQFSRLCRFEKIGCSGFVDTRNSVNSDAETFALSGIAAPVKSWDDLYSGSATVTRPGDRYVYAIDEPSAHCDAANASCRAFGKPVFDAFQQVTSTETVYIKDDITQYVDDGGEPKMLCRPSELFCDRFGSSAPAPALVSYFRDPGTHVCEWQDKVVLGAGSGYPKGEYAGWFVKGASTPTPCYPEKIANGNTFLFEYAGTIGYTGWTALCPKNQSECTEFRDPNDHSDASHPLGKPYFFINNQKLDKTSCAGKVDLSGGCALFRDMNDSQLPYNSGASYLASKNVNETPVPPVNCVADPTNPVCDKAGRCVDIVTHYVNAQSVAEANKRAEETYGKGCNVDTECTVTKASGAVAQVLVTGRCEMSDANVILKVKLDRTCATWLGCATGETVYDPAQGSYVDICTNVAVCDQSSGTTGKNFCGHYVDRSPNALKPNFGIGMYEPVLRQGVFFDAATYAGRPTGFNAPDYSSYALPNHFQIADVMTRPVGYELLVNRKGARRDALIHDYRLVAAVPLYFGTPQVGADTINSVAYDKDPAAAIRYTDPQHLDLNLCQHKQTKRIGYYVLNEKPERCYFAVDKVEGPQNASLDERNIQNILTLFEQLENASEYQPLAEALPNATCRAYPDASAPFPNSYVKEWDFTADPPKPKTFVDGYAGSAYCEFGEDCACSYRKVSYGGVAKFLSLYGEAPPAGICAGGTRDGQSCVPDAVAASPGGTVTDPANPGTTQTKEASGSDASELCGVGTCQAIQSVSLIRGQHGQCLQRDFSRTVAGSQEHNPCLIWNPSPILFGKNDVYHYQPTAGYLPPQNSGEYYCVAGALPPKEVKVSADSRWIQFPGSLTAFRYNEDYVSDADCFDCNGNDGEDDSVTGFLNGTAGQTVADIAGEIVGDGDIGPTFIDGYHAKGGAMGAWCEDADDQQNSGNTVTPIPGLLANDTTLSDGLAGRWIQTGRSSGRSYAEYFIGFNGDKWTSTIFPGVPTTDSLKDQALMERRFAFFQFSPIRNPNGRGFLGCGYTPEWVEGVSIDDYDDVDQLSEGDKKWQSYFRENFKGIMNRESAGYLKDENDSQLFPVECVNPQHNQTNTNEGKCYYKFWELGYRAEGQDAFRMQYARNGAKFVAGNPGYFAQSKSNKAFFSIRAMFESINSGDNGKTPAEITEGELQGPFQFVGWWITASVPGADSERAIYMYLTIGNLDTCREVAQVVSSDTREATAFNDRVWERAGFSLPILGYAYSSVNTPFSSAVHTRSIGIDPLFQVHGRIPGTFSKIKPPTFIASGSEYFTGLSYPTGNWSLLSNLFARVYRVYRYYDQPVGKNSYFCSQGPKTGAFCRHTGDSDKDAAFSQQDCGLAGICNGALIDQATDVGSCNALSGVNAGLSCSSNVNDPLTGYHVCHNAPMKSDSATGLLIPQYTTCGLTPGLPGDNHWTAATSVPDAYYPCDGTGSLALGAPGCAEKTTAEAAAMQAFQCASGAVESGGAPVFCTKPGALYDCPRMVKGDNLVDQNGIPSGLGQPDDYLHSGCNLGRAGDKDNSHTCKGFEHANCTEDYHCQFTSLEWWGSYNAKLPADGDTLNPSIKSSAFNSWGVNYGEYGADRNNDFPDEDSIDDGMTTVGLTWWTDQSDMHDWSEVPSQGIGDKAIGQDIAGMNLTGARFFRSYVDNMKDPRDQSPIKEPGVRYDIPELNRFPGAYAGAVAISSDLIDDPYETGQMIFIPGHCERPITKTSDQMLKDIKAPPTDDTEANKLKIYRSDVLDRPYSESTLFCDDDEDFSADDEGDCYGTEWHGFRRYFGGDPAMSGTWKIGICEGGAKEGSTCSNDTQCVPANAKPADLINAANWCKPADAQPGDPGFDANVYNMCHPPGFVGDANSNNLDLDDNLCTHNAGYYPRADLCGNDPTRPQCLTSYQLTGANKATSVDQDEALPPTDVTAGLYTPDYLGAPQDASNFGYAAWYIPRPPAIAAPDTSKACAAAGQCSIAQTDTFSLEGRTEGDVAYVGGQAVGTIRFYGWAADNQGGIKDALVDWGDGNLQHIQDAQMKNKKPFCETAKECEFIPGLSCRSDADCPPAGGKCAQTGFCKARSHVSCSRNEDCSIGIIKDTCQTRLTFGNSELACEQNFFEFTHAFACPKEAAIDLPNCGASYCSRDSSRLCTDAASDCAPGDSCVAGLAPPGGCFDPTKNACRFTPRVMLKDMWGWCTGECRTKVLPNGQLTNDTIGSEKVIYKNGGCYDGSGVYSNVDSSVSAGLGNACDPNPPANSNNRPWVIYQGALQLGIQP